MRKLISLILAAALCLCFVSVSAEQDVSPVGAWTLSYAYGGVPIAEQGITVCEDNTFEVSDGNDSSKGTWTFDGETLTLTADGETISLKWNGETRQFAGEYSGMDVTLDASAAPEAEKQPADEPVEAPAGMVAGGWSVADDYTVTEDINNLFWQAMDSYQTGTITVAYTPVAVLGTQVVAGTNYAVLCKASEINKGSAWVIVYLYRDLEENATVLKIENLALGV